MSIKILFLGEIVGRAGIQAVKKTLSSLKKEHNIDFVIANGEGVTNGFGLGKAHAIQLSKLGIDVLTGGEKIFYKLDMVDFLPKAGFILRGANFPPETPGRGFRFVTIKNKKVGIINLLGSSGAQRYSIQNAFVSAKSIVERMKGDTDIILVQFHAGMSAEKATMGYFLDGKVNAVIGTHTKVMTQDGGLLPQGTAYITDNGMCGATLSVGGFSPAEEIDKFMTGVPKRSQECFSGGQVQGVLVEIDEETNRTLSLEIVEQDVTLEKPMETTRQ